MTDIYVIDDSPSATTAWAAFATALKVVVDAGTATEAELETIHLDLLRATKSVSQAISYARYKRDNP